MKITRINSDKEVNIDLKMLIIEVDGKQFRLRPSNDHGIIVNKIDDNFDNDIVVKPKVTNSLEIK